MRNKIIIGFLMSIVGMVSTLGGPRPGHYPGAPIDNHQLLLIIAGFLLAVGVIVYKKLSLKKA